MKSALNAKTQPARAAHESMGKAHSLVLFLFVLLCTPLTQADSIRQPTIAIIVDDMGHHYRHGRELIELPYPLTLAFLPHRKHTEALSKLAHEHGKEIMLHAPMQTIDGIRLGDGALTDTMSEHEIKQSLLASLDSIPYVRGINNHMGSHLTAQNHAMRWVMEALQSKPVYFVDSRTSPQSVAARMASRYQIPNLTRDVFLDHHQTRKFVQQQFLKLIKMARERGTAVAIAHPHRVTIDYLRFALPRLDERGIKIATASALWQIRHPQQRMFAHRETNQRLALNEQKDR
ncbi:MAG: divergent polysaccharide deacetylase family protein [Oleiphilaceae bacterium]|nr:divergent polysaccharide deacetylase family protein [Oleiphilaceae bacterium]